MSERALDELRVLCEGDAEEAMSKTHHDRMMKLQAGDSEEPVKYCFRAGLSKGG
jgi:hypothetical protein